MSIIRPFRRKGRPKETARKRFIAGLPCFICGAWPVIVAHIGETGRGLGAKCLNTEIAPLCPKHHDRGQPEGHHELGKRFWDYWGFNRDVVIRYYQHLYGKFQGKKAA